MGKVGFVSLGCLKVLVDFECIFSKLRVDGYEVVLDYEGVDVVVVNMCGFFNSVKEELLGVIGEVMMVNGWVIVIGCLGVNLKEVIGVYLNVFLVMGLY